MTSPSGGCSKASTTSASPCGTATTSTASRRRDRRSSHRPRERLSMSDHDHEYIHGHHQSVLRSHRSRTAANSDAYLLPHLQAGMTVLDVGCGPGTITCDLADVVAPGQVLG